MAWRMCKTHTAPRMLITALSLLVFHPEMKSEAEAAPYPYPYPDPDPEAETETEA